MLIYMIYDIYYDMIYILIYHAEEYMRSPRASLVSQTTRLLPTDDIMLQLNKYFCKKYIFQLAQIIYFCHISKVKENSNIYLLGINPIVLYYFLQL